MHVARRRLATFAAAVLLAAPSPALAQSAGDDQYEDPFAGENQGGGSDEPAAPEPSAPAAPAPDAPDTGTAAPDTGTAAPDTGTAAPDTGTAAPESGPAPAAQPQLPYTGGETGAVMLAGSIMLAAGLVLRVRLRRGRAARPPA